MTTLTLEHGLKFFVRTEFNLQRNFMRKSNVQQ